MAVHRAGISTKTMHFDHVSARSCLLGQNSWECWCFSIGFWIHMLVSKSAINVDCKKIFKSCSTLVSKSARNVGYEKIFKSCWPAAALGLSIINVTLCVLRRLEFAADISGTCAQSRELSSNPTDQPPRWKHSTELQGMEFLLSFLLWSCLKSFYRVTHVKVCLPQPSEITFFKNRMLFLLATIFF